VSGDSIETQDNHLEKVAAMKKAIKYCFLALALPFFSALVTAQERPPNIVMIVVDDMRFDEWSGGGHSYLKTPNIDQLAQEGTRFDRAYHTTPLCSPNRASILTGQYPSRHGIVDNTSRNQASFMLDLFPKYLQSAGYKTAHIGKWHMGNSPAPRPGYDYWVAIEGQGKIHNPTLFEDNQPIVAEGYITDIFTDKAIGFIEQQAKQPFFLYIGHKAVHPEALQRDDGTTDLSVPKEFIPAARHAGTYDKKLFNRSPSYSPDASADPDKPVIGNAFKLRAELLAKDPQWESAMDLGVSEDSIRNRAEMMLAVDESLERIVSKLKAQGVYENTVIILTSDNGYFFGEHGFSLERRMPYEESVKAPLIISYPRVPNPVKAVAGLVLSIDLSATALAFAGIDKPSTIQGESLVPLITGKKTMIRPAALIEYYSNESPFPWTAQLDYRVVISEGYKYINWLRFDEAELYDLSKDPFEQKNLIGESSYQKLVEKMHGQLQDLQLEALGLK
jgi:arylsulfatase A-like enzyme